MIYLKLLFSFIKIGLFSFGGGYAMIPLIQKEIEMHGWITPSEFVDIIAIAEMTPGPIAVNSATYVGFKAAGILGSVVATIGVALPSLIIILMVSKVFFKFRNNPINTMVFYGIRPVVTGLIAAAGFFVAETSILKMDITTANINHILNSPSSFFDLGGIAILVASLVALARFKVHPILIIAGAGLAGILIYYPLPLL